MSMAAATAPSINAHQLLVFLLQIGVLLGCAVLLGRIAAWFGLPALVGELTAGVLLGPSVFGSLLPAVSAWLLPPDPGQAELTGAVAQVGVLLLVAITGAHIDLELVRRRRRAVGLVSLGSIVLPLGLGLSMGFLLPDALMAPGVGRPVFALFVGVAIAVSALPVIAKTLLDMRLLHRDVGQMIIGAAAVSDVVGWLLLSVVSAAVVHAGLDAGSLLLSVGVLLAVVTATLLAMLALGRRVEKAESRLGVTVVVALVALAAAGTHALGMEPILGAFLCGLLISSAGTAARRVLDSLRPFVVSVLAPLYFVTAGMRVDLAALAHLPVLIAAVTTILVGTLAKFAGGYAGARLCRFGRTESLAIGAGLNARGVVEIVVASVGLQLGVLTNATYTIVVLLAVVTSVVAPATLRVAMRRTTVTTAERDRERGFIGHSG
ncbi:cation:proton antiporter [Amycolatopsis sp. CA-128772]|uniref:cation:proton antiporter n=1 Tax=Amycolatopsis sp. CA-128772 TaxID=2073159 RepID=UPI001E380D52|nr:cation:proton antiporter [Amycolatopsis sp. CA-128772]